jgi:hypothetical protein
MGMSDRLVHFVYLGGPFEWQHWRAVETAKVHDAPIYLWHAGEPDEREHWDALDCIKEPMPLSPGEREWLNHPIQLANVKDVFAWAALWSFGGLYLDLDTISLQPCWDLLTRDVCVSSEHEPSFDAGHPSNSAVVLGRKTAPVLSILAQRARAVLDSGESGWGKCGPHLLTDVVKECPDVFDVAPFGVLNGWRDDTIHRYYEGEAPPPDARVVHLFSSSRMDAFLADRWMP